MSATGVRRRRCARPVRSRGFSHRRNEHRDGPGGKHPTRWDDADYASGPSIPNDLLAGRIVIGLARDRRSGGETILTDTHFTASIVPFTIPICRDFEICIPCFAATIDEKEANNCRIEDCRELFAFVSTNQIDPSSGVVFVCGGMNVVDEPSCRLAEPMFDTFV